MLHMHTELILSQGQSANAHARHDAVEADPLCCATAGTSDSEPPSHICVVCEVSAPFDWPAGALHMSIGLEVHIRVTGHFAGRRRRITNGALASRLTPARAFSLARKTDFCCRVLATCI